MIFNFRKRVFRRALKYTLTKKYKIFIIFTFKVPLIFLRISTSKTKMQILFYFFPASSTTEAFLETLLLLINLWLLHI